MTAPFALVDEALKKAEERGKQIDFWWRDDDAVEDSPALQRLLALSNRYQAPLALAIIPKGLTAGLAPALTEHRDVSVLVHGFAHINHAPPDAKKTEFGTHRALAAMEGETTEALALMQAAFAEKLVPVFVPPWNRITSELFPSLADQGYAGVSTFGECKVPQAAQRLAEINTHIDPIDWHGGRGLIDIDTLTEKLARAIILRTKSETAEPLGFLTHHLVHNEAIWSFCASLLECLARSRAIVFKNISGMRHDWRKIPLR